MEWMNLYRQIRNLVISRRNVVADSRKIVRFGKERVSTGTQVYKSMTFSHLLLVTIFDSPFFSNLQSFEVVYRGGNEVVLHLFSTRRISDKCTFGGVDLSKYYKGKRVICIGAKASLTDGNGQSIIGYVFDENENELGVRMNDTGEVAWVVRPTFDYTSNTYVYDEVGLSQHDAVGSFAITYLWPIRIKINITSGRSCIMYSFSSCIDNDN